MRYTCTRGLWLCCSPVLSGVATRGINHVSTLWRVVLSWYRRPVCTQAQLDSALPLTHATGPLRKTGEVVNLSQIVVGALAHVQCLKACLCCCSLAKAASCSENCRKGCQGFCCYSLQQADAGYETGALD